MFALMETATENTRDLRQQAGNAVASGMTWEQAFARRDTDAG